MSKHPKYAKYGPEQDKPKKVRRKVASIYEFGLGKEDKLSSKVTIPAYLLKQDGLRRGNMRVHSSKAKKVKRVIDDKPDWGMLMPKFPSALISLFLLTLLSTQAWGCERMFLT